MNKLPDTRASDSAKEAFAITILWVRAIPIAVMQESLRAGNTRDTPLEWLADIVSASEMIVMHCGAMETTCQLLTRVVRKRPAFWAASLRLPCS
jgi:hypothetical protein